MGRPAELVDTLKRLCAGQIDGEDWLTWWANNSDVVAVPRGLRSG